MAKTKYKEKEKPVGPRARNDAYVMMLFVTLVAIIAGSVLMYLDHEEYGKNAPPKENQKGYAPPKLGDSAPGGGTGGDVTPKGDTKAP
jgi:hypothetical protein